MHGEKPPVGTHYFNEKENVLYDLLKDIVIRLKITQKIPGAEGEPETTREYSIEELQVGVMKKLKQFQSAAEESPNEEAAEAQAEKNEELVLVSFYGFLAAPGLSGMLTGFHNAWLQGFYIAKLIKNRGLEVSSTRAKMTPEERTFTEEKLREQGLDPYDPERHGSGEGSEAGGAS
jgi:hypothetical protein